MPVPVYRVTSNKGVTVREYIDHAGGDSARLRALEHAARIGGRVFHIDRDGWLVLVHGARERVR